MKLVFETLLLFSLTFYFNEAAFKIQLNHRESLRTKIIKKGNLTELKQFMNLFAATKNQTLRDYYDMEYLGAVSVGTPRQEFNVVMDTGSSNFWITDSECLNNVFQCKRYSLDEELCEAFSYSKCCPETKNHSKLGEFVDTCDDGRVLFDASNSSTFQPRDGTFSIRYGTGDCSGKIGRDTMAFGGIGDTDALVVKNVLIGRTTILGNFFYGKEIDGILGLGFSSLATAGMTPPFVEAYNQNLLDNFIFTVYMHRNGFKSNVAGGQITFGGLDTVNCGDVLDYVPLSRAEYWQFHVDSIRVNGGQFENNNQHGFETISDTGTSFLVVPYTIYVMIANAAFAENYGSFAKTNCNKRLQVDLAINGRTYSMTEKELFIKDENNECLLAVEVGSSDGFWILGDPWIRSFCQIHDMKLKRIGFARPRR